jgi:hypothetical protein
VANKAEGKRIRTSFGECTSAPAEHGFKLIALALRISPSEVVTRSMAERRRIRGEEFEYEMVMKNGGCGREG